MPQSAEWDFFVSYTEPDLAWAEWIAWELERDRFRVLIQAWDMVPGANWVNSMQEGVARAERTIALLSPEYLSSTYGKAEWQAAWRDDPMGEQRKLIVLRVVECKHPGLLGSIVSADLFDLSEPQTRSKLRRVIDQAMTGRAKPAHHPPFPGPGRLRAIEVQPRFPGALPPIWNIPARNPNFTGRHDLLDRLHSLLTGAGTVAVHSLHGMGGVGKTQLGIEYAHRYASGYKLGWWIPAEQPELIPNHLARLGAAMGLRTDGDLVTVAEQVMSELRGWVRWLLVFDNAEDPERLRRYLPGPGGHVLITTRRGRFAGLSMVLDVDVLKRAESMALLHRRIRPLTEEQGKVFAELLGDLPLAMEQAAAYLDTTRLPVTDYLTLLQQRGGDMLGKGIVIGYQHTLATVWTMALDRVSERRPAARELLELCAYLASEAIPLDLFTNHPEHLPPALTAAMVDPLEWSDTIGDLVDYSLAQRNGHNVSIHRLLQTRLRYHHTPSITATDTADHDWHAMILALLRANLPDTIVGAPQNWPRWQQLLPHVLAAIHDAAPSPDTVWLQQCTATYLQVVVEEGDELRQRTGGGDPASRPVPERIPRPVTVRLGRDEIAYHLAALQQRSTLTAMQSARLSAILDTLADDGRFLLRDALDTAEFPPGDARGQEAFRDFRKRVNHAAAQAGVDLQLELDSRKAPPDQRHGWFTGGDLVDEGIASFTGQAAARTGIDHPITPEVAELGLSRRTRVYVSALPTSKSMARKVDVLLRQLREALALDRERSWEVADSGSVGLGEDPEAERDRLCAQADVRLALVSPAYLADAAPERRRALDSPGRVVTFALSGLPDGPLDLGRLRLHDVRRRVEPWDELTRTDQRRRYIADVVDEIRRALRPPRVTAQDQTPDGPLMEWSASLAGSKRAGDSAVLIEPETTETTLRESWLDSSASAHGPALPAVARLVDWARAGGTGAPQLCALLGDVGMGKTTTVKLFTQKLLDLRVGGISCPLPILFDLRDVRITGLVATMTLDHILDGMLDANRPMSVPRDRLSAEVVRRRLRQGDAVVVFDGLDEVLVHLSSHDQQLFTRQLWRALGVGTGAKMLLTCRTQYFRTVRDEVTYFTGEGRQGLRGEDYLALLMLPFQEHQVREYLAANLNRDQGWVDGFLDTIGVVHDLPDLVRRPLTLRLIADQVEFIETAKLHGRALRSVDLYGEIVERWLSRDSGKHTLIPEHKQLLMEEIAAGLWRSGRNTWEAAEVDTWLLDMLDRRPELRRYYRERVADLWTADFRTATFLKREGDTFAFGHRSLAEYFLARHLYRTLIEAGSTTGSSLDVLAMPVPSPETLDFLGQSIAAATAEQRSAALAGLERVGRQYVPQVSELAFAYALQAAEHGHPHQSSGGSGWRPP